MTPDTELQAQVDAQLMEQGAFTPLELLIGSGRLDYGDYERWRRREIELLDDVLMGNRDKIRAQIEQAAAYARGIGLVEQTQEFHAWTAGARSDAQQGNANALRSSADPQLHRLIASRFVPAQDAPQMDLFFDNAVVALSSGIVRALSARNLGEAQRQLDRLYAHAPNHADLGAFDRLLVALRHLDGTSEDPGQELDFLLETTPIARRLLGSQSRDLLTPLWRKLAAALQGRAFAPDAPNLHRSFALSQAQDWAGVSTCVLEEPQWWLHAPLCLRLAQSGFHRRRRVEALTAWCHLCWHHPDAAADALDERRQPDSGVAGLWQSFLDSEESCVMPGAEPALTAAEFPAWLLLHEPGLAAQLPADLPAGDTAGEAHYRYVHRWIHARRANRQDEEMALRKALQASQPALFRYLKQRVSRDGGVRG